VNTEQTLNLDPEELAKFERMAQSWWDPKGDFRPLHEMNPLRLEYISERAPLAGAKVLDAGCGGGILCEAMARRGARVTGLDLGETALEVARQHAQQENLEIEYLETAVETLATERESTYDVVCCLEMLEHVPDPGKVVQACARLARPGGQLFFSTLDRNPRSWLFAIVGAEYVLRLLPRGTHDYARFIRPAELAAALRDSGLLLQEFKGMKYNPFSHRFSLSADTRVNYLAHASRPSA